MENVHDELDAMTGLEGGGPRPLTLDLLSLNGDAEIEDKGDGKYGPKGGYYRLLKLTTAKKDEKPEEEKLGESVSVIFLKVRRSLQARNGDQVVMHTSEHSKPDDVVELHSADSQKIETGSARALRDKYPALRTIQYVYGLLMRGTNEPQLVKMRFKGSALGSDAKAEGVKTFYDYIYADHKNEDGSKKHLRHMETILGTVKEQGKKSYFTVTFAEGRDLSPELCKLADDTLRDVHAKIVALDETRSARIAAIRAKVDGEPTIEIGDNPEEGVSKGGDLPGGDEGVNPDDIPF